MSANCRICVLNGDYYTCRGVARGGCGTMHRTLRAALACLRRDQRAAVASRAEYSDRSIEYSNGAPLTREDRTEIFRLETEHRRLS